MIYFDVFSIKKLLLRHQYDIIIGSLQRPCNFDVSQCINSKFIDMGNFDLFSSKMLFIFKFKACMTS